jgi:hypothetical protein
MRYPTVLKKFGPTTKHMKVTKEFRHNSFTFVLFATSFENIVQILLCSTAAPGASSVIPAKAGIQANSTVTKPGFPRARE